MIKIKALNDGPSSDSDSESEYQVTREAEEENLNQQYLIALKAASDGNVEEAKRLFEILKQELEIEDKPKVKDALLLKRLKYLTYKNLGLLFNDINMILNALDLDGSDFNLWITAGRKSKDKKDFFLARICFESAYGFNQSNYIVIDNLIDIYFILNDLYKCVNLCLRALEIDSEYLKGKLLLNECIRLMPPMLKEITDPEHVVFVSEEYGGNFSINEFDEDYCKEVIHQLTNIKNKRLNPDDVDEKEIDIRKKQCKQLILELDETQLKSLGDIGTKIIDLYLYIRNESLNICTPIELTIKQCIPMDIAKETEGSSEIQVIEQVNLEAASMVIESEPDIQKVELMETVESTINSQNGSSQSPNSNSDVSNLPTNVPEPPKEFNLKSTELNRLLKANTMFENIDKRRSSRANRNRRETRCKEYDEDQSIFENLLELLATNLKNNEGIKLDLKEENSSSSSSVPSQTETPTICQNELNSIRKYIARLEKKFLDKVRHIDIYELIESFLVEIAIHRNSTIPKVFTDIYQLYREQNELPVSIICEIGKHISIEMIHVCLTANEITFNRNEALFLIQIIPLLNEHMNPNDYREFIIRLLVLCGNKEFNNDYLEYALDLCSSKPQYASIFNLKLENNEDIEMKSDSESNNVINVTPSENKKKTSTFEVMASNNLLINIEYIETILEMQTAAITFKNDSNEKNYMEIIKSLFTSKSESDLSIDEKNDLCEAIVQTQMWQKGVEMLENWTELSENVLFAVCRCVETGKRARLTSKFVGKIIRHAMMGKSSLPWTILYWVLYSETENSSDQSEKLVKLCQYGHSFLGKKGICTEHQGEFLHLASRIFIEQELDDEALKCFTCLYNFPQRNGDRSNCHTSPHVELEWRHCTELYHYIAPEKMPEYDSHVRLSGVTQESKELFLKISQLVPDDDENVIANRKNILNYINNGEPLSLKSVLIDVRQPNDSSIQSTIYYLLADYHFKSRDFVNARKFYNYDLALNPNRFDSWAGLSLSMNYKLDQMLGDGNKHHNQTDEFKKTASSVIRCFERALELQPTNWKLWIEFGLLTYNIASNLSRTIKMAKLYETSCDDLNLPFKCDDMLEKARHSFTMAQSIDSDELWLTYYMLGKVSEKKSGNLLSTLDFYMLADLCLYLDGATYPKKINYYNPSYLSIEAIEIHYRIHASILKYLIYNRKFSARMLRQLKLYLFRVSRSPFVSRRNIQANSSVSVPKKSNSTKPSSIPTQSITAEPDEDQVQINELMDDLLSIVSERDIKFDVNRSRNQLIELCIVGLKRCLARYPAHYKSYHRLANYFELTNENEISKAILMGGSGNKKYPQLYLDLQDTGKSVQNKFILGLFVERKPNNLYNCVWRIPVEEIERTGTFNAHMFRCTLLLINQCIYTEDFDTLSTISIQLNKQPELDKRYLNEQERIALSRLAFDNCFNILKNQIEKNSNIYHTWNETQRIAQIMVKNQTYVNETLEVFNQIRNQVTKQQ